MKKNENNLRKVWKVQKTAVSLHYQTNTHKQTHTNKFSNKQKYLITNKKK